MAVENKYVNSDLQNNKLANPALIVGADAMIAVVTFETAAADDNASIYRLLKNLSPDLIPINFEIFNDAITGGTDWDLGLYEPLSDGQGGAVVDADVFVDGADLSSGNGTGSPLDGLSAVDLANRTKKIYEHGGHTIATKKRGYDLALTANVVGSGVGTITVVATFVQG